MHAKIGNFAWMNIKLQRGFFAIENLADLKSKVHALVGIFFCEIDFFADRQLFKFDINQPHFRCFYSMQTIYLENLAHGTVTMAKRVFKNAELFTNCFLHTQYIPNSHSGTSYDQTLLLCQSENWVITYLPKYGKIVQQIW